jgi:hypothetical protein
VGVAWYIQHFGTVEIEQCCFVSSSEKCVSSHISIRILSKDSYSLFQIREIVRLHLRCRVSRAITVAGNTTSAELARPHISPCTISNLPIYHYRPASPHNTTPISMQILPHIPCLQFPRPSHAHVPYPNFVHHHAAFLLPFPHSKFVPNLKARYGLVYGSPTVSEIPSKKCPWYAGVDPKGTKSQ